VGEWSKVWFTWYKHWATYTIRGNDGTGVFLSSKEGVTQGDPLSVFANGVGMLLLLRVLKVSFPSMDYTWYDDDAGVGVHFYTIQDSWLKLRLFPRALEEHPFSQHSLEAATTRRVRRIPGISHGVNTITSILRKVVLVCSS
jgi:hypothetical protein